MTPNLEYIPTFLEAAKKGGEILRSYFGKSLTMVQKSTAADMQTQADLESEAVILPILEKAFPKFNVLSEERGETLNGSEYTIVVDPLDGTHNFILGIPNFTIIIALLHRKEVIAGLIYHPMTEVACYAEKGRGAFLNGKQLFVNKEGDPAKASISYVASYHNAARQVGPVITSLYTHLKMKRAIYSWSGAADACLVACGKAEALINDGNVIYDYAASKVIVREAGGKITGLDGQLEADDTNNVFLLSNGTSLHEQVLAAWRPVRA